MLARDAWSGAIKHRVDAVVTVSHDNPRIPASTHRRFKCRPRTRHRRADQLDVGLGPAARDISTHHRAGDVELHTPGGIRFAPIASTCRNSRAVDQQCRHAGEIVARLAQVASPTRLAHQSLDCADRRSRSSLDSQMVGRLGERRLGGKGSGAASETGRDPRDNLNVFGSWTAASTAVWRGAVRPPLAHTILVLAPHSGGRICHHYNACDE